MSISKEAGALPIESMRKTEEEGAGARLGNTQTNVSATGTGPHVEHCAMSQVSVRLSPRSTLLFRITARPLPQTEERLFDSRDPWPKRKDGLFWSPPLHVWAFSPPWREEAGRLIKKRWDHRTPCSYLSSPWTARAQVAPCLGASVLSSVKWAKDSYHLRGFAKPLLAQDTQQCETESERSDKPHA